ncbi:glycosyltransferase family 61 protein [Methylobacterium sp. JK268]
MPLRRLSKPVGQVVLRAEDPAIRVARDVAYLPYRPGAEGAWGLFDRHRRPVPDSYDFRQDPTRPSDHVAAWPSDVGAVTRPAPAARYLYAGTFALHYGHFLINTLPRLWPLLAGGEVPPILCHGPGTPEDWARFGTLVEILRRLGLTVHDIRTFDEPVLLRELVVPASSLQEETFVHAAFGRLCDHVARGLYGADEVGREDRPVYLSKARLTGGVRRFVNEEALTERLARGGVDIVYPEELDFAGQVRLFATRRTIIGSLGSALHTAAFAPAGRRLIIVCPTDHYSATFALIDALKGHRAHYYYPVGTSFEAFRSGFHLDFTLRDPEGVAEAILRRLEHGEDLERYDYTRDPLNWHLSPTIPPLPAAPGRAARLGRWWREVARRPAPPA